MVIAAGDEGVEGVFAGMASGSVPTIVTERDRLGESNIEPERTRDGCGDLCDLQGVCEPCSLVVVGEDEDLGLASEAAKCRGMKDAVAITFEAGPVVVGLFGNGSVSGTDSTGCPTGEKRRRTRFALDTHNCVGGDERWRSIAMCKNEIFGGCGPVHRCHPLLLALSGVLIR
jgi:hypothetical protein